MVLIQKGNETVVKVCGKQKLSDNVSLRPSCHVLSVTLPEGELLYHTLTGEMYFVPNEEKTDANTKNELSKHWFFVPESFDERKFSEQMRTIAELLERKTQVLTSFSILTTTDCNARCYYCYEAGIRKYAMTDQIAHDTARFIINSCGGKKVALHWFGGEPLFNSRVIDLIVNDLVAAGIEYKSTMISNGYLFDGETVKKAAELWKLKNVQITLDGRKAVYNCTKAYIYKNADPYETVLGNIDELLRNGIAVVIRLNLGSRNAQELTALVGELAEKFGGRKGFSVYTHLLFDNVGAGDGFSSLQESLCALQELKAKITELGLGGKPTLTDEYRVFPCMAASDKSVMIMPNGDLGKCEHHIEDDIVGTIYEGVTNREVVAKWKEHKPYSEECEKCAAYPICSRKLKHCISTVLQCPEENKRAELNDITQKMIHTYEKWKTAEAEKNTL